MLLSMLFLFLLRFCSILPFCSVVLFCFPFCSILQVLEGQRAVDGYFGATGQWGAEPRASNALLKHVGSRREAQC
ncbi:hypothetical protein ES288_A05G286400v1 [Gossypium darwinii]|uniref:Secreted protein n=2 Tax=Gossypium TaxID=3633 RepID=A0A5D2QKB1_GOSTO|nr:hypothetical protein ES288_A05G286400v1 [Gossypium darwinii]TYI29077.1 hypothetical protein ES332_A05G290700v1 [Gossypium tomentosum]